MTATPHNGKEEDFQLFLSLLDSDRFYGKFRDGVHKVDASDLMRRMVKEELVKFDGTPLFPERRAYTVNYKLSDIEAALYEAVTDYVKTEMGKADQLDGARKGSVGFALTALQRRLASSPEAIYQSLKRRRERLERRLREEKLGDRGKQRPRRDARRRPGGRRRPERRGAGELWKRRSSIEATAAKTIAELEAEIVILQGLEEQAKAVVASGQDRKWDELSKILQNNPEMHDAAGPPAQAHHLLRAPRHAELPAARDRRRARQRRRHRHHPRRHPPRRAPQDSRRCSAPTPMCAFSSPPMPPAKA